MSFIEFAQLLSRLHPTTTIDPTQTVSHPRTQHLMMSVLVLISELVIITPHVHMFKLSMFAFLNLRPQELTGCSSDVWRVNGGTAGPGDVAVSCSGASSAVTLGACS